MSRAQLSTAETTPLRPLVFEILLLLNDKERHGYGIMKEVNDAGNHSILGPGTLYRTLKQMRDQGWIELAAQRPIDDDPEERRRYYTVTDRGRRVAAQEAARMAGLVEVARAGRLLDGAP